jgi:hypothetical protein
MSEETKSKETKSLATVDAEYTLATIEPSAIESTMKRVNEMRTIVQKNLTENHDYGKIPGCPKPSLWKPGAEKILVLFGLTSEYEIVDKVQDYEKGFFAFTVRCFISRNGQPVTQGVGHCNTKERKYQRGNPYDLANTVLKMAKKRAQVDAVLTVASLSDIFTQDLEDTDIIQENKPKAKIEPKKKPSLKEQFNAIRQEYIDLLGNPPHAENAMKKVAKEHGFEKVTAEYLDELREDLKVRKHEKETE